jgi:hypothetical protein
VDLDDSTLLCGFISKDAGRTLQFLERLIPELERSLRSHWPTLQSSYRDIIGACGVMLVQWREELRTGRSAKLHEDEPIAVLADRLVNQEARKVREWNRGATRLAEELTPHDASLVITPEEQAIGTEIERDVEAQLAQLPVAAEQTLRAQLRHESGDGPPLHQALGCSRGAARVRLTRARQALIGLLHKKETT